MRRPALIALVLFAAACTGGKRTDAERQLFDWAKALQIHLTTSAVGNYTVPESLEMMDPVLTAGLSITDPWGSQLHYRTLRDDRYQLISAGPDSVLGNDDDVIVENGVLRKPADVYAQLPIKR